MNVLHHDHVDPADLGFLPMFLEGAANGPHVAFSLSNCLEDLRLLLNRSILPKLAPGARDKLLRLIVQAEFAAQRDFPADLQKDIYAGMQAFAGIVTLWGTESFTPVDRRSPELKDMRDRARILQNHAFNEALREQIETRAYRRRAEEIEGLLVPLKRSRP